MNKREFIEKIAQRSDVTKAVAAKVLDSVCCIVTDTLQQDDVVVLPGFGSFQTGKRSERTGRNPQTGQVIRIKASRVAKFKPGKKLKEAVQS